MPGLNKKMDQKTLEALDWPMILACLEEGCFSLYGQEAWQQQPFLSQQNNIESHLADVDALHQLLLREGAPVTQVLLFYDIRPALSLLAKGGVPGLPAWGALRQSMEEGLAWLRHWHRGFKRQGLSPEIFHKLVQLEWSVLEAIRDRLVFVVSADGQILDTASPRLISLKQQQQACQRQIEQTLRGLLSSPTLVGVFQDQVFTQRDGRYVLPVKIEHKSLVSGIVHAGSGSGATLFVEPQAVVVLNNQLEVLRADYDQEIQRLLKELSEWLVPQIEQLQTMIDALAQTDKRATGARLARQLRATVPRVLPAESQKIQLRQLWHPVLKLQNTPLNTPLTVIANDIALGQTSDNPAQTLVITGPNTGGKTVLLKALGLSALMLWAGLPLPVAENSEMSLFSPVFADLGDAQDLSQNLSTFSGHLKRLKTCVDDEACLQSALVLVDEIVSGTDPDEGAALAKALLETFMRQGALTVITTHLGELKTYAHEHPDCQNASMAFNVQTLSPTYQLRMGIPGTSHALTIAEQLGLPHQLVEAARSHLAAPVQTAHTMMEDLAQKQHEIDEALHYARSAEKTAREIYEGLMLERQQFQESKRQHLRQFKDSLKSRLHSLEDRLKRLKKQVQSQEIRHKEIKPEDFIQNVAIQNAKLQHLDDLSNTVFADVEAEIEAVLEKAVQNNPENAALLSAQLRPGMAVRSKRLNLTGVIETILPAGNQAMLVAGNLRVQVPFTDLELLGQPKNTSNKGTRRKKPLARVNDDASSHAARLRYLGRSIGLELDIRGERADDALLKVQQYLDQALLSGLESVGIIHGLGTGALKQALRHYLGTCSFVSHFTPAPPTDGGDGKTLIYFKVK